MDHPHLLRIGGAWRGADDGATFTVREPATGAAIAAVPRAGARECRAAIAAAVDAQAAWREESVKRRGAVCHAIADRLMAARPALARLRAREGGTALATALAEVEYAAGFFRFYGDEIGRLAGRTIVHPDPRRRVRVEHVPIGVVGAITPWNLPLAAPAKKLAPAIAAGCAMVLKPSELTPLSALAIAREAELAGLPPGVLNVVCGDAAAIGGELTGNPAVRALAFTGSTRVGRQLMAACAPGLKRVALELGGSAPFVVFADADLERAADDCAALKTANAGQVCVTANRVLVERPVHDRFVALLVDRLRGVRLGDPLDAATTMGPLISDEAAERVAALVAGAVAQGAIAALGGARSGAFHPPMVLTGCRNDWPIAREEIFGPVAPVIAFDGEAEALALANDTPYGLAAFAYTGDADRQHRLARALEAGVVGINDPRPLIPSAPFGGVKQSGIGREGGSEGLLEYLDAKLIGVRE
ncbi:MAG TPA: aldehyde dehydrogenase family protein [Planctomycetota bacterium]|nr:aldehyde dehydrogenase family protein [Planctomycetota bacterium]